jgi:hypothetical protein
MTTSAVDALAALRTRLEDVASGITIPLRWQGEDGGPLPDIPTTFAFVVFDNQGSGGGPAAFGGGRGANLYRNRAFAEIFVFAPNGEGLPVAMAYAETIAAWLRSFRSAAISCFAADVLPVGQGSQVAPPGLASEVSNYMCAVAEIILTFDQIG